MNKMRLSLVVVDDGLFLYLQSSHPDSIGVPIPKDSYSPKRLQRFRSMLGAYKNCFMIFFFGRERIFRSPQVEILNYIELIESFHSADILLDS